MVGALVMSLPLAPAWAAWTDVVPVSGTAISAHVVSRPASAACTPLLLAATVTWPDVDPRYDYEVTLRQSNGSQVGATRSVTSSSPSTTYTGLVDFGLSSLSSGTFDYTVEIRSYLTVNAGWRSAEARSVALQVSKVLGLSAIVSC